MLAPKTVKGDDSTAQGNIKEWRHANKSKTKRPPISGVFLYLCPHSLTQNDHVQQGNTCGERPVSWGQPRLPSQGSGAQHFQFLRFSIYAPHHLMQDDQVRQGNTCGGRVFLGVKHAFLPKGRSPSAPQFWGSLYLRLHHSMQNDQILHGSRYRERDLVLGGPLRPPPRARDPSRFQFGGYPNL